MRLRTDLEQGTYPWRQWRWDGLGGSDAGAICAGLAVFGSYTPYCTAAELLLEKSQPHAEREETFAMRRGRRLEEPARQLYVERTGLPVKPLCVEHADEPWLRASLDGWWQGVLLEIKCPKWKDHEYALEGLVPRQFRPQLTHQCLVAGVAFCHYWSFNDGARFGERDRGALVAFTPTAEESGELLDAASAFWSRVIDRRRELATEVRRAG